MMVWDTELQLAASSLLAAAHILLTAKEPVIDSNGTLTVAESLAIRQMFCSLEITHLDGTHSRLQPQ